MKKILFVCMGNICRSPSAEAVMNGLIKKAGFENEISCDSAGTIAKHTGEPADGRMQQHALRRGYTLTSISRQIQPRIDFENFDYLIAMDDDNMSDLHAMNRNSQRAHKICKMTDFCQSRQEDTVPDPYYGGSSGFELVLDILEDACAGLLAKIQSA